MADIYVECDERVSETGHFRMGRADYEILDSGALLVSGIYDGADEKEAIVIAPGLWYCLHIQKE